MNYQARTLEEWEQRLERCYAMRGMFTELDVVEAALDGRSDLITDGDCGLYVDWEEWALDNRYDRRTAEEVERENPETEIEAMRGEP